MPGSAGAVDELRKAVSKGSDTGRGCKRSAANVLRGVLSTRIYQGIYKNVYEK